MSVFRVCRLVLLALCAVAPPMALAQETINNASVSGRVTDPSGAVVQGAQITARQTATNLTSTAITDADGRFRFAYLRLGPYEIKVQQPGFRDALRSLTLTVGSAFELPITLAVVAETNVTVTGEAPVLEAARTQIAGTVPLTEVQNLPLNGRNFLDIALFIPGVSPTNTASNQLFAETSAVPGQGLSVSSQRNFSNSFIVDGVSANDDAAGLSGIFYGLDVVQEFQVVTSGGQAEFGRALGGYMNVVTKSGTNTLAWRLIWLLPQSAVQLGKCAFPHCTASDASPIRRESRWSDRPRPHVLLRELRATGAEPIRSDHDCARQRRRDQRQAHGDRLSGTPDFNGPVSQFQPDHTDRGFGNRMPACLSDPFGACGIKLQRMPAQWHFWTMPDEDLEWL